MIALQQETPRAIYPSAYDYYIDYYSEEEENAFLIIKNAWENIHRSNDLSQKLTKTELKLISLVSTLIKRSPLGLAYFSLDYLCAKLGITDRQLRTVRKNINHIFSSRWRKATRINGALKKNVYVFAYTRQGRSLLDASTKNHFENILEMVDIGSREQRKIQDVRLSTKYYKDVKLGSGLPTSINKDEKYIKNRSCESSFCKDSKKTVTKKTILANSRKKLTNAQRKARVYLPKFKQYDQQKSLGDHYPLSQEDCAKLQITSGRDFTLNAMNEILLDMSRKPKLQLHSFVSKARFMAYMAIVYRYEGRDAVKTANSAFKLLTRATEAEIIQHTTQAERENYLNLVEQQAITHRSDENQLKAKLANTLPTNAAYNLLSNLKTMYKNGKIFEIFMAKKVDLTAYSLNTILQGANAVGGYCGVEKLEFIME